MVERGRGTGCHGCDEVAGGGTDSDIGAKDLGVGMSGGLVDVPVWVKVC